MTYMDNRNPAADWTWA